MKIADTSGQDELLAAPSRRPLYIWGAIAALVITGLLLLAIPKVQSYSTTDISVPAERLRLATVTRGDLTRDLSVQARVVAAVSPTLYSPADGTVTLMTDAGDSVSQGQILAQIDSPELSNQLKQQQSGLASQQIELDRQRIESKKQQLANQKAVDMAKVALTAADREKRRADKAYSTNSISQLDYEKAQDDLENAKLIYQHALQDGALDKEKLSFEIRTQELLLARQTLLVEDLERQVQELTVRSPVDGIVGNLAVAEKNQVSRHQPLLSVVDLSQFELEVAIPESYADDLSIGVQAQVNLNGQTHEATLVTISPEIENNQVTGRVRFSEKMPQGLRQNQRLTTRLLMENKADVLMVQRGQFLETGSGRIAYLVDGEIATKQQIQTGARSLNAVEILDGLNPGDTIIISGTDQFRGADTVLITQ
ncbi:efflux RND transporter periplasmic adaptor subunit [Lacimicrobium alkaliphilum]|uniref:RND transporter MFP subunit n=1 Tax=Lacimicrobium alkaliphilum TaxID=1526571 RepID=A0ABQ1RC33_9ALTE|nr:efflux RND transporter periplasmic adaptor subunit [Lacimicrobium alkaliphilum]GGD65358.1 RND transporter MFP subunit [Lacimicrobium alkaliphilum]